MPVAADLPPFLISPPAYIRREKSGLLVPDTHVVPAMLPGMVPLLSRAADIPPRTLTYRTNNHTQISNSSYTWSGMNHNIGPEAANRRVILAAYGIFANGYAGTIASASVNGITLTKIVGAETSTWRPVALFIGILPTGNVTSVSMSLSGPYISRYAWALFSTTDLTTTTAAATYSKMVQAGAPYSVNVVTQPGDNVVIAGAFQAQGPFTHFGFTETYDRQAGSSSTAGLAGGLFIGDGTTKTMGWETACSVVAAVWR